jgi:predicted methyltransferase
MHFLQPHLVAQHFDLKPGMHVAELHAGSGFFTPYIEKEVGTYGVVHSFQHYRDEMDTALPEKVDRVIVINVPVDAHRHSVFSKAYGMLKSEGKIIIIDPHLKEGAEQYVDKLASLAGFVRERRFNAGNHHFGLVFKKI